MAGTSRDKPGHDDKRPSTAGDPPSTPSSRPLSAGRSGRPPRRVEQPEQEEARGEAAEMGDPGHRHVGKTELLRKGPEDEIGGEPDPEENAGAGLDEDILKRGGRNRIDFASPAEALAVREARPAET